MQSYYYSILLSTTMQSLAYVPLLAMIYDTRYTGNIPYVTLFMLLLASLIQLIVATYNGFYFHLLLFMIYFLSISVIITLKYQYDPELMTTKKD